MARNGLLSMVFVLGISGVAFAQTSDPAWLDTMNAQILEENSCEVVAIVRMSEGELGGRPTYEARVRCADGRMYDATRIGEGADFEFKACEIQVC